MPDRPAATGLAPGRHPGPPVSTGHTAPCPRRVRARDADGWVLDTTRASYVWEQPYYPQYAVPRADLPDALRARTRPLPDGADLDDHVVLPFDAAEAWFEEDEPVHVHPRNPYVRVDALRSSRTVTVALPSTDGTAARVLARSANPVAVFETGLPPRWYLDPTDVDWSLLTATTTVTHCPYKGDAGSWWSAGDLEDVAWSYTAPALALTPIAGLVCFDDSLVDVQVSL